MTQPTETPGATPPASTETVVNETPTRPEWCPEEFWNAETGTANTEGLARKLTEVTTPKPPVETPPAETPPAETPPQDPPFVAAVEAANADLLDPANNGKLRDETYASFESLGLSRDHIDAYIEGQQAKAQLIQMRVYGEVGGEESFNQMFQWGIANYTETERTMFDKMMQSGNTEEALAAAKALKARHEAAEGKQGASVVPSEQPGTGTADAFKSKEEVVTAMRDPRYRTDAAYRKTVEDKLRAANKAGIKLF